MIAQLMFSWVESKGTQVRKGIGFNYREAAEHLRPELVEKMNWEKRDAEDSKDTGMLPYRAAARLRVRASDGASKSEHQ